MSAAVGTYIPHTEADVQFMLNAIGVSSVDELFSDIPEQIRSRTPLEIPDGVSEFETYTRLSSLAARNERRISFLGAGSYDHIVPSVVRHMTSRPEFVTAYTPYQAEISQGILQAIFEFQTLMCQLTGLDVANASLYDGHSAAAEACSMAVGAFRKRKKLVLCETVHPYTRKVVETFFSDLDVEITYAPAANGLSSLSELKKVIDEDTAGVLVQTPNMYGLLEQLDGWGEFIHENGAMLIVSANPMSLGCCASPGEWGADIAVADGQPLGLSQYYGGPSVGIITATEKLLRKMPGRIVGQTTDVAGRRAFVLTLQAREQHIKRARATSNICSNQALAALSNAIYLGYMGKSGFRSVSERNAKASHYFYELLMKIDGVEPVFEAPFFNEFCIRLPVPVDEIVSKMMTAGFYPGIPLQGDWEYGAASGGGLMIAVTEKRTHEEMMAYAKALEGALP